MYEDYQNQKKQQDSIELFPVPQRRYYPEQPLRPRPTQRRKPKKKQQKTYNTQRRPQRNRFVEGVNQLNTQGKKIHSTAGNMAETFTKLTMLVGVLALGFMGLKSYLEKLDIKDLEGNVYGGEQGDYTGAEYDNSTEQGRVKNKIIAEAKRQGVDPAFALAVAETESHFNQNAKSGAGAIGVFQLMPDTAKGLGVNPYDLDQNIQGGIKLLKGHLDKYGGDKRKALATYNWGSGNLAKYGIENAPAETKGHYQKIMNAEQKYKNELAKMNSARAGSESTLEGITKRSTTDKGSSYAESSNITSHTKLTTGTNEKYSAQGGSAGLGTYDGYSITSGIGHRQTDGSSFHRGLDLAFPKGTPVKAFCSGTVTHVGVLDGFGRCIIINDDYQYRHVYGHLSGYKVANKQHVTKGQVIGYSGTSGTKNRQFVENRFPPHLHYGIWRPGGTSDKKDYIDPRTYTYPPEGGTVPQTNSDRDKVNKGNKPVTPSTQKPTTQNPSTKPKQNGGKPTGGAVPVQDQNIKIPAGQKKPTQNNTLDISKPNPVKSIIANEDAKHKK